LLRDHLAAPEWRVTPRVPFALGPGEAACPALLPPLIRGYLHLGAEVCGPPSHDPEFGTADVLITLAVSRLDHRRARRLLAA
jgi:putative hemolysin